MLEKTLPSSDAAEVESLSRELADAYRRRIRWYQEVYGDTWPDAFAEREANLMVDVRRRALTDPPEEVSFDALSDLADIDPRAAQQAWERVKQAARDEVTSGHRAAQAVELRSSAWQRAQFAAIRSMFIDQWQPVNGGEHLLIDMLAQTYTQYLVWMSLLTIYTEREETRQDKHRPNGRYEVPRVTTYEAQEQAAAMVDRFNRLHLRTLRALRDLRRFGQQITINNPGQVNIAQQQVNAAQLPGASQPAVPDSGG